MSSEEDEGAGAKEDEGAGAEEDEGAGAEEDDEGDEQDEERVLHPDQAILEKLHKRGKSIRVF
eukprot:COSAG01_NODE_13344_length_1598_cov_1.556371_2_plen_63_part_00